MSSRRDPCAGKWLIAGVLGVAIVGAWGGSSVLAQTTDRSGIVGKVTDETGAVLPGVTVVTSSPAMQVPQLTTVTGLDGEYRFTTLPAGTYAVTYELQGFQTIRRDGIRLAAGFTAALDIRMSVGGVNETVTVSGESPLVDARSTTTQTNLSSQLIEAIPTSRSFYEILAMAEGIRTNTIDVGGSATGGGRSGGGAYGTNTGGYTPMLDGVNTMGTAGYYDTGALEEVVVKTGGSDAEMSSPGYSFLGVVKSGGNEFHGSGLAQWQSDKLQSSNVTDELRARGVSSGNPMKRYYDVNADLGGRIIRDRLWFFGSTRRQEYEKVVLGYSAERGPDGVWGTPDDVQGFSSDSLTNFTGKLSAQLTPKQKGSWMHHFDEKHTPEKGGSRFKPREATGDYRLPNHVYKWEWTYTPTDRTMVNAFVGRSYWKSREVPYTDLPSSFDLVTQQWRGAIVNSIGIDSTPSGSFSSRWQYASNVTHYRQGMWGGDHEFRLGVELHRDWYNKFQELRGPGTGGTGNDYLLTFFNGEPQEVLLRNTPFNSRNNVDRQYVFLRDNWQASDRLTLNLGVRFERSLGYLPAQSKEAGPFSEAASFPYMEVWDWTVVTPRTGLSYALTADKRTLVKATWGRFGFFVGPNEGGAILRPFNQNDYAAWRYRWADLNGNRDFEPGEQGALLSVDGSKGTVYNPVRQPKAEETTVFFERELTSSLSAKAGYVYKRLFDQYRLVNEGRPYTAYNIPLSAIDPGPDGVIGTGDDGGPVTYFDYDPAFRGADFERSTYRNLPDDIDSFHNLEFAINKRLADRWQLSLSYLATREISRVTPLTPNVQFADSDVWHNTFKALGTYRTFWDIYAGARFEYLSGTPQARDALFRTGLRQLSTVTLRLEPVGSRRLPAVKLLSLRAAKKFKVGSHDLEAQFDVHNALNEGTPQSVSVRSGPTFGQISSILPPRVARVGVSYRF